jgi:hypothetical protein
METSLHHALKDRYGPGAGGRSEVSLRGFRIDAVASCGQLVEIQSGPLGPLRRKLGKLLADHRVLVVKPVVLEKRVVRRARPEGPDLSVRRSPKQGAVVDVFEDLVGLARVFPHPNLAIEVLGVAIDEIRIPRRRWPGYRVVDRRLGQVREAVRLERPGDLWRLLADGPDWTVPFTTLDIAARTGRPVWIAQRVAYCLRNSGAARVVGKAGNRQIYLRNQASSPRLERPSDARSTSPPGRHRAETASGGRLRAPLRDEQEGPATAHR